MIQLKIINNNDKMIETKERGLHIVHWNVKTLIQYKLANEVSY